MPNPKDKMSKSRTRMRRARADKRALPGLVPCPECKELKRPHRICPHCGYYKNRLVVQIKTSKTKKSE